MTALASRGLDARNLKSRFDLVDFVGGYVALEQNGAGRFCGCCPFHSEKTPSFYVFENQTFKCFGCGAGGDLFSFVQKIEGLDFKAAKTKLARGETLCPLPLAPPKRRETPRAQTTWQEEVRRSGLRPLAGTSGEKYLAKRCIPLEAAHDSKVRFASDWYRQPSVLFPIVNRDGATVAVQGRAIKGANKITKGPKSLGIFATMGALDGGQLAEGVAICEAPIDALSVLVMHGVPAIATCGSGLPAWIVEAAQSNVVIATDSDKQGDADFTTWGLTLEVAGVEATRLRPFFKDWNMELQYSLKAL